MFSDVKKVLIVAPLRVCLTVWEQEVQNWEHTNHLTCSLILGNQTKRERALHDPKADIYIINYENLAWLVAELQHYFLNKDKPLPFDMVVWDEVSKMKTSTSQRGKAVFKILKHIPRKIGLTGTPASNGIADLHGQFLVIDNGERLGTHITHFRERFMNKKFTGWGYEPRREAQRHIENLVHDITLQMSAKDYLEMPPFTLNDIYIPFPEKHREMYDELEREMVTNLESGQEVAVFNAAALTNKLLQFANGAVYKVPGSSEFHLVHELKLEALEDIIEESGDNPILLAYSYKSDQERILKKFPFARSLTLAKGKEAVEMINDWNAGKIKLMVGHPASMGHGLNLQRGGHTLVFFGIPWALDLYDQFIGRVLRQGQSMPVICHRIMMQNTIEDTVRDSLDSKASTQADLRAAIHNYAKNKRGIFT